MRELGACHSTTIVPRHADEEIFGDELRSLEQRHARLALHEQHTREKGAGEEAGLDLPYGCREGICHTCVGTLCSGQVRDLRTGKVYGQEGEMIRTCISAPEGPVEIDL